MNSKNKQLNRQRRHSRVRARIVGTAKRPRISVFKSNKHIFVQFIDDTKGKTIFSGKDIGGNKTKIKGTKTDKAFKIGKILSEKAKEMGIKEAVFDRGGFKYHGRIKALADSLREGKIKF